MTEAIDQLDEIADRFDAIVLDQWGVLHDGTSPYPGAVEAVERLHARGSRLAVLSNSGKRSDLNAERIAQMGFTTKLWRSVMTSGEALWSDIAEGKFTPHRVFAVTAKPGDAQSWAKGLNLIFVKSIEDADAVLIMGLPESEAFPSKNEMLAWQSAIVMRDLPVYCSNPDKISPRAGGALVMSPGALAHQIEAAGGQVRYYGKPHLPVFRAVQLAMNSAPNRCLMVGDSLEHDIAGAEAAGWSTAFVRGGIHSNDFEGANIIKALSAAAKRKACPLPDFTLSSLR